MRAAAAVEGFWNQLFSPGGEEGATVRLRVLRKQGRPFLALPPGGRAAVAALSLYPAQTGRARAAKTLLCWLLRAGVAMGTQSVSLTISRADPFAGFLSSLAGAARSGVPGLAILAGNPGSPGRRFVVLVLDAYQRPVAVAKAGLSEPAKALVRKEQSFLEAVAGKPGVPKLRGAFQSSRLEALALDYIAGDSPRPRHEGALPALLWPWVDAKRTVTLSETPEWQRLAAAAAGSGGLWPALAGRLRARALHPAIGHGDLAPWNIKISPQGHWTALDWERGQETGIAGWDWFHYVIQRAILVEHRPVGGLVQRVEELLDSQPFQRYAAHTGIAGFERELVLAYLLYSAEVIKPAEGLPRTRELIGALTATLGRKY
ncbi:MAG: hypothetical protein ABSH34_30280 [Verrucomicrobiota bacterium]|jgi:hypothetical protein